MKQLIAKATLAPYQDYYEPQYLLRLYELYCSVDKAAAKEDRTGVGRYSKFGGYLRHNTGVYGPALLHTKQVHLKSVIAELCWFLRGDTNVKWLQEQGCRIWNQWRKPWPRASERKLVKVKRRNCEPVLEYFGEFSNKNTDISNLNGFEKKLASSWVNMMSRCYNPSAHNYKYYGARGVTVCSDWHNVLKFIEDVQKIPHWWYKLNNWNRFELDKDYYGAKQYGPSTCVWLPKEENVPSSTISITSPEGEESLYCGYTAASEATGFTRTSLHRFVTQGLPSLLKANNKSAAGWEFKILDEEDELIRHALVEDGDLGPIYPHQWRNAGPYDQIARMVETILEKPADSGNLVCSWNVNDINEMALRPCHTVWQVCVNEGVLDLMLYQRCN